LVLAWTMYADDNHENLVPNWTTGGGTGPSARNPGFPPNWVYGYEARPSGPLPDCINPLCIENGLLWPYVKSLGVYRCPAATHSYNGKLWLRGQSMNCYMGPAPGKTENYTKTASIRHPDLRYVFMDEDQNTINDGTFRVDLVQPGTVFTMHDWPGTSHGGSGTMSFADGHSVMYPWKQWGPAPPGYDPDGGFPFPWAQVNIDALYLEKSCHNSPQGWW
jgi:prepilin-type processing-associated H-X9-DG protein